MGGPGHVAAFIALAMGAPLAALALWRSRVDLTRGPAALAVGGLAGLAAWCALSILWAAAPDLSWIEANRIALAAVAMTLGVVFGRAVPRAPVALGVGLAAAAAVPVGLALATKALPEVLGSDRDLARLSDPLGYWNALAAVAALAIPGTLWLAGRGRAGVAVAGAYGTALGVTLLLTLSRGGLLAAALAAVVTLALLRPRVAALAALLAAAAGAAWPAAFALGDSTLSADGLPVGARAAAGAGLGWRLVVGMAVAATLAPLLAPALRRVPLAGRQARATAAATTVVVVVVAVAALASSPGLRDALGADDGAVANDTGRLVETGSNNRPQWWAEAGRGALAAPLGGYGGGGFRLVHLAERPAGSLDAFNPREPHQLALRVLSGLGVIGLAFAATALAGVVWATLRVRRAGRLADIALPLAIGAAYLAQAQIDWTGAIPALAIPAAAAGGVIVGRSGVGIRPGRAGAGAALLAGLAALLAVSALLPWLAQQRIAAAQDALVRGEPHAALSYARQARSLNPLSLRPLELQAQAYDDLREPARRLGALRELTEVQPDNPRGWAAFAAALGDDPRAEPLWRRVVELSPQDARARAELAARAP